ncbi:hypothetical protein HD597_010376 [Nonomuraea thailandensis]|uniref:DUF541 domain-containing protein n=1 Tax=Nonomuraea thailandensis TaxID=1188745 RepID=A0A9X2KAV8_9ACTN|nr:hypothetical protein [Nonomuraea thailandensis]MCP2363356.1 hypothetical protein [Nonomuraea thailandensis]
MVKRLLAALCLLVTVSGCNAAWWPETVIKVDPGAVTEVRSVGRVVTQTFTDPMYERTVQVIEILVVDMQAADFPEALDLARDRLEQLGWKEVGSTDVMVQMESSRWKGTTTRLGSVEDLESLGAQLEPAAGEALQADAKKWATYILVSLSSVNE